MKKFLAIMIAGLMAVTLTACSAPAEEATSEATSASTATEEAASTATEEPAEDTEPAAEKLIMGTNAAFPPYEYIEDGEIVGIDAEIAAAIAEKLGLELEIQDMEFDAIIPSLTSGKINVGLAGMTVTPEREENVNFSDSYATGVQVIIVKEGSAITSVDDLFAEGASHTIGVQRNTTGDLYTTWDLEDEGLATIDRYSRGVDAVQALITDKVDCVVIDNEPAKAFVEANEGLVILDTEYIEEQYAIAMSKDNEELYNAVNDALAELIADGTVAEIVAKYIPAEAE